MEVKPATTELDPARFCLVLFNTLTCISAGLGSGLGWSGSEGHMTSTNAFFFWYGFVLQFFHRFVVIKL